MLKLCVFMVVMIVLGGVVLLVIIDIGMVGMLVCLVWISIDIIIGVVFRWVIVCLVMVVWIVFGWILCRYMCVLLDSVIV